MTHYESINQSINQSTNHTSQFLKQPQSNYVLLPGPLTTSVLFLGETERSIVIICWPQVFDLWPFDCINYQHVACSRSKVSTKLEDCMTIVRSLVMTHFVSKLCIVWWIWLMPSWPHYSSTNDFVMGTCSSNVNHARGRAELCVLSTAFYSPVTSTDETDRQTDRRKKVLHRVA